MLGMIGGPGIGIGIFSRRTCQTCGMKFPADVDNERMMHHLWRFHNDKYHSILEEMYEQYKDMFKAQNSFKSLEQLKDFCELKMINFDINMGCSQQ